MILKIMNGRPSPYLMIRHLSTSLPPVRPPRFQNTPKALGPASEPSLTLLPPALPSGPESTALGL